MTTPQGRELFINLPVRDLDRTKTFFGKLGFDFNPRFTDDNAACMNVNERAWVMLLREPFFQTFTDRALWDRERQTEALMAFSCASREAVDALVDNALAAGGRRAKAPVDHGFMYSASFYDLDGHHWEALWMDMEAFDRASAGGGQ